MWYKIFFVLITLLKKNVSGFANTELGNEYVIDTDQCKIPSIDVNYPSRYISKDHCGVRLVHVHKVSGQSVKFIVKSKSLSNCSYQFILPQLNTTRPDSTWSLTVWRAFRNHAKVKLRSDFINVRCLSNIEGQNPYEDAYAVIKKVYQRERRARKKHWNVLVIGMDTMSRTRAYAELPRTVTSLTSRGWLDFRGYNKVGLKTFENLMRVLTNRNISSIFRDCKPDSYSCNDIFIWSRFKQQGYVTAFSEDWPKIAYTWDAKNIMRFRKEPTDHYARTFFLSGEKYQEPYYCTKKILSPVHELMYAHDFMNTYKKEKFFGFFWLNTLSHNIDQSPLFYDEEMKAYFERLEKLDVLDNTFIVFMSDHGTRYSYFRQELGYFYESRLPMLFVRVPKSFKQMHPSKYSNMRMQQERLVVPFDVHLTMWDLASNFQRSHLKMYHESCAKCSSLFNKVDLKRTCSSAGIEGVWCTCRLLKEEKDAPITSKAITAVLQDINLKTSSAKVLKGYFCETLSLSKLTRIHMYVENSIRYYLLAGSLHPEEIGFEAILSESTHSGYNVELLDMTTAYSKKSQCCEDKLEIKIWCVCAARNEYSTLGDSSLVSTKKILRKKSRINFQGMKRLFGSFRQTRSVKTILHKLH